MKKILAMILASGILLSLSACGESQQLLPTETTEPLPLWAQDESERTVSTELTEATIERPPLPETTEATIAAIPTEEPVQATAAAAEGDSAPEGEEQSESEKAPAAEETAPQETAAPAASYKMEEKFKAIPEETVYAIKRVNIREQGNVNSIALDKLQQGKEITRVGVSEDGWSAVLYDDKVCYIASEYLSKDGQPEPTENPNIPNEQEVDDMVYTVDDVNMREGPGFDRAILCRVPEFVDLHRTAIVSSGWCKVTYKDKVGYISIDYLAEKNPSHSEAVEEDKVSDVVYTTREVNLRRGPGTDKAIVSRIPQGTKLERTAVTATGWGKVTYEGEVGYVSGDYLSSDPPAES